ncbi:MAG: Gldg family protein [Pseudomonadota bacterium]
MKNTAYRKLYSAGGLALLAIAFLGVIAISQATLRGLRIDLTENKLYTLSEGTRNILKDIDEPVHLKYYFSDSEAQDEVQFRAFAGRVREMLEEIARQSDGNVKLSVIDPVPFSEEEDEAAGYGLAAMPLRNGSTAYMGLAGTNAIDGVETIPVFQWNKEEFLEYDIAKLIYTLANPKQPVIGLVAGLQVSAGFDPATRRPTEAWAAIAQLEQLFEVRDLGALDEPVAADVDALLVIHPKALSDEALYAIDQFALRGGRVMAFVDPYADIDIPPQDPNNMAAAFMADRSSNLNTLFRAWGIEVPVDEFVADARYALQLAGPGGQPMRHLAFVGLTTDTLNREDVVAAELESINVAMAGFVRPLDGAGTTLTPLIESSDEAASMETDRLRFLQDPGTLRDGFVASGEPYVLAARVSGTVETAFPEGAPGEADADNADQLMSGEINAIVVADVDMLADRLWVQVQSFFGQSLYTAFANNGDFLVNAMENFTGSSDLIAVRSRPVFSRPFEKVEELRREADDRYRETEQSLQQELQSLETRLAELQSARSDDASMIMTAEQSAEIQRFVDQRSDVRRQLRQVRRDLDKDIESLHTRLKLANILLVPLALLLFAFVAWLLRRNRRSAAAREATA